MYNGTFFTNPIKDKLTLANDDGEHEIGINNPLIKGIAIGNNGAKANLTAGNFISLIMDNSEPESTIRTTIRQLPFKIEDMTLADNKAWTLAIYPRSMGVVDFSTVCNAQITGIYTPNDKATNDGPARIFTSLENSADGKNKATIDVFTTVINVTFTNVLTKDVVATKGALVLRLDYH